LSGNSLPVSSGTTPFPTLADFPLIPEPSGFNGGWTIYRHGCDACSGRPCVKHLALIQKAYAKRAATATARVVAADEGVGVVAAAEGITALAVASLVSA